jgi:hypothetical protein
LPVHFPFNKRTAKVYSNHFHQIGSPLQETWSENLQSGIVQIAAGIEQQLTSTQHPIDVLKTPIFHIVQSVDCRYEDQKESFVI